MTDSRLDFDAALESGAVRPGSPAAQLASADAEAARALAGAVLDQLPLGPAEGEDEAAWAALGLGGAGLDPEDSLDLPAEAFTAQPMALDSIEIPAEIGFGDDDAELLVPTAPQMVPPPPNRSWMWGVAASLLLGVGAIAAWFAVSSDDGARFVDQPTSTASAAPASAAPASAAPATVAIAAPKSAPVAPATVGLASGSPASAASAAPASAAPTSVAMAGTSAKKPAARRRPRRPRAPARTARKTPEDVPPAAAPAPRRAPARPKKNDEVDDLLGNLDGGGNKSRGRPSPAPAAGGNPLLPKKLSKRQILGVVRKNAGKISACKAQDPNASGTVKVTMVINKDGRVGSANVGSGPFKGTPVARCVEGKVRSFRFPQFSGDAMRINMPFRL